MQPPHIWVCYQIEQSRLERWSDLLRRELREEWELSVLYHQTLLGVQTFWKLCEAWHAAPTRDESLFLRERVEELHPYRFLIHSVQRHRHEPIFLSHHVNSHVPDACLCDISVQNQRIAGLRKCGSAIE
jgi:hypothetical protein